MHVMCKQQRKESGLVIIIIFKPQETTDIVGRGGTIFPKGQPMAGDISGAV